MSPKNQIIAVYLFILVGTFLWLGTIFLAPYLKSQSSSMSGFLYALFSPVCHQLPSRSFVCFGYPLAVCARCLGIYVGFLIGVALFPVINGFSDIALPKTKLFIILTLPIGIDTLGNFLRLWASISWLRFVLGFLWGIILPYYFIVGIVDLAQHRSQSPSSASKRKSE